ncbi:hypothetical protein CCAX7_16350 [Capsulimonas corticalis]|uniref:ATP-grasp domain-containing protein n=1 Tax=Capsulimonas corticalis TaxID=2219043 RepID=A0A402CZ19_9BACT|nr:ATP-grasp domain-containing protein [Capsulimonas corticalis]BDI29584.1 hypothetical protein CCAX7_16350 [Capsulimonas corticalis]
MPTLVTPAREDEERDAVVAAWVGRGWSVRRLDRFWEPPILERADVRLYGDMTFCLFLAERLGLELISPPDDLLLRVDARWLGRDIQGVLLADALQQSYPIFVKSAVPKLFRAAVYDAPSDLEQETIGLAEDTLVLVSNHIKFTCEVRCLIRRDKVVSAAVYEGEANVDEAKVFAEDFVRSHAVAVTYILDVGWIEGHGWAVIEANAIWGGGLNGCDPEIMADCLALATIE